ncbi:unnamed protein product, partial [Iphiclides podalirius]
MGGELWIGGMLMAMLWSAMADSWTAFQEQPCCRPISHHRVRHHRGISSAVAGARINVLGLACGLTSRHEEIVPMARRFDVIAI